MNQQLDELKAAVKAVAKARAEGKPLDLSNLPPHLRQKIEAQLQKLPPEAREQLQHKGLAAVDKVAQRVGTASGHGPVRTPEMPKFHSHYNGTIKPGDATRVPWTWFFMVIATANVLWKFLG